MTNILELMQSLSAFDKDSVDMAAKATVQSGLVGAKDVYMAWGKSLGIPAKALEEAYKSEQPTKAAGPKGFADSYYDWLAEASRTEQEAADLILSNESANVQNHLTHYLNIWALAETVRAGHKVARTIGAKSPVKATSAKEKAPPKDTWEYNSAAPYESVRAAKFTLKLNRDAKRPSKNKVHPDKVAHLGDAELTALYTEAFQILNK